MRRFIVYDNLGNQKCELNPESVIQCERYESVNAEHSLTITTTQVLSKNQRIIYQDGRGIWREYVIIGVDEEHTSGRTVYGTYYCVWSLQVDMQGITVSKMPGVQTPVFASVALGAILEEQSRWSVGTVTNTNKAGASMYDMSAWEAMGVLIANWQGELDVTITVSNKGVIGRSVDYYAQMGENTAKRRYDFGADLKGITRSISDEPYYCRISPRGKGEETESGGYGRKITIESVNGGKDYLEYAPMVSVAKIPNGSSGYIYPTLIVENGDIETPAELKTWAQSVLEDYCTPKVSYDVDVVQAGEEGVDVSGVSLGDTVQIVDGYFGDGLRLSGRVMELTVDELQSKNVNATIGALDGSLSQKFAHMDTVRDAVIAMNGGTLSTAEYLTRLLERINGEINATGGYTYITEGQGIRTYDAAVSDPTIGAEATAVVEVKGGTVRIANSKTAQGEWQWKTVFTSGHVAANLITAAQITTGYIGSASGGNYWDLDAGTLRAVLGLIGGFTIGQSALYNGPSSITDNTVGVYLGTDGLSTVGQTTSNNKLRMQLDSGAVNGFKNGTKVGTISPNASVRNASTSTDVPGIVVAGDALYLTASIVGVGTDGDADGSGNIALTNHGRNLVQFNNVEYNQATSFKFTPRRVFEHVTHGMKDQSTLYDYTNIPSSHVIELPTKLYVDGKIPTFSLSGNNLFISV